MELLANIIVYGFGTFVLIGSIVNYISERKEEQESKKDENGWFFVCKYVCLYCFWDYLYFFKQRCIDKNHKRREK